MDDPMRKCDFPAAHAVEHAAPPPLRVCLDVTLSGDRPAPLLFAEGCKHTVVPRGTSAYHYTGCGCGTRPWAGGFADWIWDAVPGQTVEFSRCPVPPVLPPPTHTLPKDVIDAEASAAVVRLRNWSNGAVAGSVSIPDVIPRPCPVVPLRVAYLIPHHNVTGGMKMIMTHIRLLQARGHSVIAVFRGHGDSVLPPWAADVRVHDTLMLSPHESVLTCFTRADVIVIGYFTQLLEFEGLLDCPGPVVYWEQGHEHIFGDPSAHPHWDTVFHSVMHLPIVLLSVSNVIRDILWRAFSRIAPVVPNAIDCTKFVVSEAQSRLLSGPFRGDEPKKVIIVGHPYLPLKNFDTILKALAMVHSAVPSLEVTWMCQTEPTLVGVTFPIRYYVNPAQADIPGIYQQGYHALLFASLYEAWGMPVMEAMACGIPVVTSYCHGVDMFCVNEWNCVCVPPLDVVAMAHAVIRLITRPEEAALFSSRGRSVVEHFTWDKAMTLCEDALLVATHRHGHIKPTTSATSDAKT